MRPPLHDPIEILANRAMPAVMATSTAATPSRILTLKYVLSCLTPRRDVILIRHVGASDAFEVVGRVVKDDPQHGARHRQEEGKEAQGEERDGVLGDNTAGLTEGRQARALPSWPPRRSGPRAR